MSFVNEFKHGFKRVKECFPCHPSDIKCTMENIFPIHFKVKLLSLDRTRINNFYDHAKTFWYLYIITKDGL